MIIIIEAMTEKKNRKDDYNYKFHINSSLMMTIIL